MIFFMSEPNKEKKQKTFDPAVTVVCLRSSNCTCVALALAYFRSTCW